MPSFKKWIAGAALVFAMVLIMGPSIAAQQGGGFKNLQVLKDIPPDQIQPTMRFFTYSLGVACQYCHVAGDFPNDDKEEKKTARAMISMVAAINKNSFNGTTRVTCYTCHRGANEPAGIQPGESTQIVPGGTPPEPPAGEGRGGRGAEPPVPAAAAPALPTADAIFAKYVQALGGEQALRKIAGRTMSGERDTAPRNGLDEPWAKGTFEMYQKAPNLTVMTMRAANGQTTAAGFDGTSLWTQSANGGVAEATGISLARAKRTASFYEPLELKQEYTRIAVRGIRKVGDRDAYLVVGNPEGDSAERLYFDTQTGLLLRRVVSLQNVVTNAPIQTDYLDYREANGVKYPSTIKMADITTNPVYTVLRITKADFSMPVDTAKFTKPESRPQGGRGGRGGRGGAQ